MANWYQKNILPSLLNSTMGSKEMDLMRRNVLVGARGLVLEIGVGPGHNLPLYKNIKKLYALEPSPELIKIAKMRAGSLDFPLEFLQAEAEKIPLPDQAIDTVISTWTLCSVTDLRKVLQEVSRVLKPQGQFIFLDHGASPKTTIRMIQKISTSLTKNFTGNCHHNREIERLIKEAGFQLKKIEHPISHFKPLIYNYQGIAIRP